MGYFANLRHAIMGNEVSDLPPSWKRDPADDFWFTDGARVGTTAANVHVTVPRARQVPVVRDCLQVLSQSVGGLPFGVFEFLAEDARRRIEGHPIMTLLSDPNPRQTSVEFVETMVDDMASWGFFLAELIGDGLFPSEMHRCDPQYVQIEKLPDRSLRFRYREPGLPEKILLENEVWYIPVPPLRGNYLGTSAILDDGREAIGAAIGLHNYANSFWGNDATPPFVFKHSGSFKDKETKRNFLRAWYEQLTGRNRGKPGILEYGIEVEKLGLTNEQSQFLETRKEIMLDVSRIWRMPPHKVGILDRATFSNIEQQSLEFVVDTLMPWIRLIEASVKKHLLRDNRFYFLFNVTSLLRGDTASRFTAYQQARQWGWMSVNEIRALENMNPIGPQGDIYLEPLNMVPVGQDRDPAPGGGQGGRGGQEDRQRALRVLRETVARPQPPKPEAVIDFEQVANENRPHLRAVV